MSGPVKLVIGGAVTLLSAALASGTFVVMVGVIGAVAIVVGGFVMFVTFMSHIEGQH